MQSLKISDVKNELKSRSHSELIELCLRLAKYKVENKELLTYLLMEAPNEEGYVASCKTEINDLFSEMNRSNYYLIKKGLRKILRIVAKRAKYSGQKETEIELLVYFFEKSIQEKINLNANQITQNIFLSVIKKIEKLSTSMHEDLQFDTRKQTQKLSTHLKSIS